MSLTVQVPRDGCLAERAYIAEVLLRDRLGLEIQVEPAERADTAIVGEDGRRLRMPDRFFQGAAAHWLEKASLPQGPLPRWLLEPAELPGLPAGGTLPLVFAGDRGDGPLRAAEDGGEYLALDVFGAAFFLLSRYEEAVSPDRDWAQRFPSEASLARREGFLGRPLVDEYLTLLWGSLQRVWPALRRRRSHYAMRITHDLDWPYATLGVSVQASLRHLAGDLLHRRCPSLGLQRLRSLLAEGEQAYRLDPNNTFEFIMDVDEGQGRPSAFFFICGHTGPDDTDGIYNLDQPWIRHLLRRFRDRGHEVGIHPSFKTFTDGPALRRELASLHRAAERDGIRQDRWGGRQHYLRWEASTTWRLYEEAGLSYDSTLGYADRPGFRCGTCHPYRTYDLQARRPLKLVERPMVLMDGSLFWKNYMDLDQDEAMETVRPLVEQCRAYAGEFVLLWHNTRLLTPRERNFYRRLIAMAR